MNITLTGYGSQNTDFIPWGLAVDTSGNIYAVDGNSVLLKFDSNGNYIANWSISLPTGVAVDTSGNVYVSQMWGNIQKNGNFLVPLSGRMEILVGTLWVLLLMEPVTFM